MARSVSVRDLRNNTAEVVAAVQAGETLTLTVNREPVADIELLPVDEAAALMWARMRVHLAESGRRVNVNDLWVAACAACRELPVVTQDDDFEPLAGVAGLRVIRC